ncbi:MAG: hypothetical protein ACOC0K_00735 [bacterium]
MLPIMAVQVKNAIAVGMGPEASGRFNGSPEKKYGRHSFVSSGSKLSAGMGWQPLQGIRE